MKVCPNIWEVANWNILKNFSLNAGCFSLLFLSYWWCVSLTFYSHNLRESSGLPEVPSAEKYSLRMLVCTFRITDTKVWLNLCSLLLLSGFKEKHSLRYRVDHGTLLRGCHRLMPCVQQIKFSSIPFTLFFFDREISLVNPVLVKNSSK